MMSSFLADSTTHLWSVNFISLITLFLKLSLLSHDPYRCFYRYSFAFNLNLRRIHSIQSVFQNNLAAFVWIISTLFILVAFFGFSLLNVVFIFIIQLGLGIYGFGFERSGFFILIFFTWCFTACHRIFGSKMFLASHPLDFSNLDEQAHWF